MKQYIWQKKKQFGRRISSDCVKVKQATVGKLGEYQNVFYRMS